MFGCDVVEVVVGEYPKSLAAFVVTEINKKEENIYKYELKKRKFTHPDENQKVFKICKERQVN
jgi:hypothetical protein